MNDTPRGNRYLMLAEKGGRKLPLPDFIEAHGRLVAACTVEFMKIECLQQFQEPEHESYHAFMSGDRARSIELIPQMRLVDKETYLPLTHKAVRYGRIRLVERPLSRYLQWELETYKVTARWGEHISIVDYTDRPDREAFRQMRDFLVFDRSAILVNDYGDDGIFCGGWELEDPVATAEFLAVLDLLQPLAVPLAWFECTQLRELK